MTPRDIAIDTFLSSTPWASADRLNLAGDASTRSYKRLTLKNGTSAVLMDAPAQDNNSNKPFVQIAKFLTNIGLSAPEVFLSDHDQGLMLIEDLGDDLFARVVQRDQGTEQPLYFAAANVLTTLQRHAPPNGLQSMDSTTLAHMTEPVFSWYIAGADLRWEAAWQKFHQAVLPIFEAHLPPPTTVVLRDYHAENLLWLPDRKGVAQVGLLDFQDALVGHRAYDLVSLLQDARRDVPQDIERRTKAHFISSAKLDPEAFDLSYSLLGAQRNLRIIGVFARLCMHFGKPDYIDLIPRVYNLAMRNLHHPILQEPAAILRDALPAPTPEILKKLKSKCATIPKL